MNPARQILMPLWLLIVVVTGPRGLASAAPTAATTGTAAQSSTAPAATTTGTAVAPAGVVRVQPTTAVAADREMVQLNLPENFEVKLLIDYVSQRRKVNVLYDDAAVRKRVTLVSPTQVPADSLMGLLAGVLKTVGLALVEGDQPGWLKVVASQDLLPISSRMQTDPGELADAAASEVIAQVFTLEHTSPDAADKGIRPLLSKPGGNSFIVPNSNLILVTDYADTLRRVAQLIDLLDRPGPAARMRFVQARHLEAAELAQQVSSLLADSERLGAAAPPAQPRLILTAEPRTNQVIILSAGGDERRAMELIEALDVPTSAETRTYRLQHVDPARIDNLIQSLIGPSAAQQYRSTTDAESGLLIVTAPPYVHQRIEELQSELDVVQTAQSASRVRFYRLVNTTAAEVLSTIRAMEGQDDYGGLASDFGHGRDAGQSRRSGQFSGPNAPPAPAGREAPLPPFFEPTTQPSDDDAVASGGPSSVCTKDAVLTADRNTNSIIVAASPAAQETYRQLIEMLDRRRPQVMIEVSLVTLDTSDNFSLGVELSRAGSAGKDKQYLTFSSFGLSDIDPDTGVLTIEPGIGFNGALVGPDILNIVIRTLATSGRAKVLSAPRMLINDNATAILSSVAEAPFTSINASETVSTTSFAGYASAGTTLNVTPHISEGDHLQLEYSIELNSFTGSGSAGIPPPRQTNTLSSEVTVPDGYGVIVGGLTRRDKSYTDSRLPLLGRIPILKYLFGSYSWTDSQNTLFVFIRPVILRDDRFEDLKYLSDQDRELAQLDPNLPVSWPLVMN